MDPDPGRRDGGRQESGLIDSVAVRTSEGKGQFCLPCEHKRSSIRSRNSDRRRPPVHDLRGLKTETSENAFGMIRELRMASRLR